jgi:hypothetical protein
MPSSSIASITNNIFKDHAPDKIFDSLDSETITTIQTKSNGSSEEDENTSLRRH